MGIDKDTEIDIDTEMTIDTGEMTAIEGIHTEGTQGTGIEKKNLLTRKKSNLNQFQRKNPRKKPQRLR